MRSKINFPEQGSETFEEVFTSFIISQTSKGVSATTIRNLNFTFRTPAGCKMQTNLLAAPRKQPTPSGVGYFLRYDARFELATSETNAGRFLYKIPQSSLTEIRITP